MAQGTVTSLLLNNDLFHVFALSMQSAQRQRQMVDKCDYTYKVYFRHFNY